MNTCPICDETKSNVPNHIRLAGGDHGEAGEYPDGYDPDATDETEDDSDESDGADDGADDVSTEPTTVEPDDFLADQNGADSDETDADESDDSLPFDPDDPDAHELEGGEPLTLAVDGGYVETEAEAGDWLLVDEANGMVTLYDPDDDEMYEVKTA